jgi:hypothetical protein
MEQLPTRSRGKRVLLQHPRREKGLFNTLLRERELTGQQ